jgi:sugar lactone lactonase YvrE
MKRFARTAAALACTLPLTLAVTDAGARERPSLPRTYLLHGDPGDPAGSKFEGIGVSPDRKRFYVSEVTGGEIHRGKVRCARTRVWLKEGSYGRVTARGITTDRRGRVYIAGGPNSSQPGGAHDLWVHAPSGRLLAALDVDIDNPFLNDVAVGPDGAAYVTNSNEPVVFRVARRHGRWKVTTWADARGTIETVPGFNLGGIVVSSDRTALVVAQGTTGQLWRFDLRTRAVTEIDTHGADLTNADGLVLRGSRLFVIRNFSHVLVTLRINRRATSATVVRERATDPNRVFTTAKLAQGRLLLVDSKFDEPVAEPPYQVVSIRVRGLGARRGR